jgi:hypothetical protein
LNASSGVCALRLRAPSRPSCETTKQQTTPISTNHYLFRHSARLEWRLPKVGFEGPSGVRAQSPCYAGNSTCYLPVVAELETANFSLFFACYQGVSGRIRSQSPSSAGQYKAGRKMDRVRRSLASALMGELRDWTHPLVAKTAGLRHRPAFPELN